MFSANVRRFPLSSIFTPLHVDMDQLTEPLVYQRIAAVCVLPKSNLLVILTFKFNYFKDDQKRLSDQLLYVCTHDYVPKTCVRFLSKPELKKHQSHFSESLINMVCSPDERYVVIYTPRLILFYELVILQSHDSSTPLHACQFLTHILNKDCTTASGTAFHVECFDDLAWSATRPCVFVLSFTGKSHMIVTITLKESQSNRGVYTAVIADNIHTLSSHLSALSITNVTSTDSDSCVCCINTTNPLESKDGLINKIRNLLIIRAAKSATQLEKLIVCGGYLSDEEEDKRTAHFANNFIECFEVCNDDAFTDPYVFKLKYRNSIFEPIRSPFLFPTMQLSVSPRSVVFPFGIYSIDKQITRQFSRLGSFKKNLSVCRIVKRNCFKAYPDTSKLSEAPTTIYTGYPIVATAISSVSFLPSSTNRIHHKFVSDGHVDLERFITLQVVELLACADTRGYVHIYLTPLHHHRIFSAKLPLLAEKMTWTSTLCAGDRTRSVFTLYVIGVADLMGQKTISEEGGNSVEATRILKDVRTIYSIELPIVDIVRILSVARTTAPIQYPVYELNDSSSHQVDDCIDQPTEPDIKRLPPEPETETPIPLEYPPNDQDEEEYVSNVRIPRTAHINISVKEEYSFYEFPSAEDPPLEDLESGVFGHADEDQAWSLLPEEEEIAGLFGEFSNKLIEQTTRLLAQSHALQSDQRASKPVINYQGTIMDTTVKNNDPMPIPLAALTSDIFTEANSDSMQHPIEAGLLTKIVLPQGDFTIARLFPSNWFSPSLVYLTACPMTSNILLDACPIDHLVLSENVSLFVLSNGTAHLICHSSIALSIVDTYVYMFNPQLLVLLVCGKSNMILSVKRKGDDRHHLALNDVDSTSSNNTCLFLLLRNKSTLEYHIILFKLIDTKITMMLQSPLNLQYSPEYIYLSDSSVQIALSNGSLFILHVQSFLASMTNGTTGSAQHILQFTDISRLLTPVFNILQTESILLSRAIVQYIMGRVFAQGDTLMSRLASAPLTTPIDLSLHDAVLRSSLYKALNYGLFEFEVTGNRKLITCLISNFQEVYKESYIDMFVEISNNSKILAEKLAQILS
ncbi:hypothetical protein GSB_152368 [Giardia duodenalis]|uniref:Uncharacterized protein n=2 Tax=Giardia intestinalis TaxID=5741 RepID=C6LUW4_GIAIB|nr:Hypothetical protein GL50581_2566 [Giardia intestinalis ATCC 50581]ESU44101.1 hypothetical protein GSB_152368 [Giardia intestinalis]